MCRKVFISHKWEENIYHNRSKGLFANSNKFSVYIVKIERDDSKPKCKNVVKTIKDELFDLSN